MDFESYLKEINKAYQRGDATEHTHRTALKILIEALGKKITATNEPKRIQCGAPDFIVSRRQKSLDQTIGYVEAKDIGTNLTQAAKSEQIKTRYLPSLTNFILTDYIEFRWYLNGQKQLTARLAEESAGKFTVTTEGEEKVGQLFESFLSQQPEKIKIARELAEKMAHKALMMRDIIRETFRQESETGTLHGQFEAFREVLLHDLTEEQFADMYAQTICYGLFSARCHIDDMTIFGQDKYAAFHGMDDKARELTREHAAYLLPKTNPFLRKMFNHIAGPDLDDRIVWLVDDLVELLRQADMGVILRDFARRKKRRDPVVHFYETFLAEYDPKLKKTRGVYYTPDEVVSYIVRSVDVLLQNKFGLKRGLADDSKIKGKDLHKLLILDPAVGTGTFLHEVVNLIHDKFKRQKGAWSGYVKDHLLPRIFGFELMMAPYAVAHMKLGLQLAETGYDFASEERLGIYLTNTLEEAEETSKNLFAQYLSQEAMAANKVKKDLPIMVVTGNPPYSYESSNIGKWIRKLIDDYYHVDDKPLGERNPKGLLDDYVKFIRFAQWRIEQTGYGILAFISNHGYLDNPTFRGMRQSLMKTFDEIYLLDLHGNKNKKEKAPDGSKDVNVFDIRQGVAIGIFVKCSKQTKQSNVHHSALYGLRNSKYKFLESHSVENTDWVELAVESPFYLFIPQNTELLEEYNLGYKLNNVFLETTPGLFTSRDSLTIHYEPASVWSTLKEFVKLGAEEAREKYKLGKDVRDWKVTYAQKDVIDSGPSKDSITEILYRPFDIRYTYYTGKTKGIMCMPRNKVMRHYVTKENIGIVFIRQVGLDQPYTHFGITKNIIDNRAFYSNKGYVITSPLYLYPSLQDENLFNSFPWEPGPDNRVPNLSEDIVKCLSEKLKLEFVSDGIGDLKNTFGPEDIFHYIYAVFHSPEYRKRYAEFLKIDFPRVPLPKGKPLFAKLCKVGQQLTSLHLLEAEILDDQNKWPDFSIKGSDSIEKGYPKYVVHADRPQTGKVHINQDQYFEGVRPEVWQFHIGGYQVCEKWLKDRRGRKLSYEDVCHYQKITVTLDETIKLMAQVDKLINAHGGWPMG